MQPVKMVDLQRQHQSIREPLEAAIRAVLDDCDFIMGRAVAEFESELRQYLGGAGGPLVVLRARMRCRLP